MIVEMQYQQYNVEAFFCQTELKFILDFYKVYEEGQEVVHVSIPRHILYEEAKRQLREKEILECFHEETGGF